jgi:hypothetical protein
MISGCQNKKSERILELASIDAKARPNEEKSTENREVH